MDKFEKTLLSLSVIIVALVFALVISLNRKSGSLGGANNILDSPSVSSVSVPTAASTEVASANVARKYLKVWNTDANDVWCAFGETATTSKGIYIAASGGSYEVNLDNLFIDALNCYSDTGTSIVTLIQE